MITRSIVLAILLNSVQSTHAVQVDIPVPAAEITPTASSTFSPPQAPVNLVNGAGLNDGTHDNEPGAKTMWHTVENPAATTIAGNQSPAWVRFDFAKPQPLHKVFIWNQNQSGLTNRGFRNTKIFGTRDGSVWTLLAEAELKQGGDTAQCVSIPGNTPLKAVAVAAVSNWGGNVYGLSEVSFVTTKNLTGADLPFPTDLNCTPLAHYRIRPDGKPGRELRINLQGAKLYENSTITVECDGKRETSPVPSNANGVSWLTVLLPDGASVAKECPVMLTLHSGTRTLTKTVTVPPKRQWTVYLFPHSHVDVGYTNPQDVVENIHMRNLDVGMEIGKATANYPAGARHVWNNEVLWAVDSWLKKATPEQKQEFVKSVKSGQLGLSASYVNANTSTGSDEELIRFFAYARKLRELTGVPIDTMCQFDIPGMSWGLVQAATQNGVRAILDFPNPSDRTGLVHCWRNKPFYWVAPDGTSKVLYIQIFPYNVAWKLGAFNLNPKPYIDQPGRDRCHFANSTLMGTGDIHPGPKLEDFIRGETDSLEHAGSPYDIMPIAWSLSDNAPVDADLPDAVKQWNETYAYPKLVIASAETIANAFAKRFGDIIPEHRGDLTEYWTDGLGTDARRVGYNRPAKETLVQAEILWTMLGRKDPFPRAEFDAAWRWIQLGTEHTWGYMFPDAPIAKQIEATKASYFEKGRDSALALLGKTAKPVEKNGGSRICVFNTLPWKRTGIAALYAPAVTGTLRDAAGKPVPVQKFSSGGFVYVLAKDVPALGAADYITDQTDQTNRKDQTDLVVTPTSLENGLVKVTLDPRTGDIASLVDKRSGHEFVNPRSPYALNSFRYLRGADAPDKASGATEVKISIKENGPLLASLLVESKAEGCKRLTRELTIVAGQPQIEISNVVDKIATRNKEGIHFGFAFNLPDDATTRMDIPWGVMNPATDQLEGANKNWLACQRWVDVSSADCGVTWVPREASIIQFGDITANLLGSVNPGSWSKKLGDTRTIMSWALNNHWHTNFPLEQGGVIPFNYAILPHGAYDPVTANRFAMERAQPLLALPTADIQARSAPVAIDNPRVFFSALKPADDGKATILRLRSLSDQPERVKLTFPNGAPKSISLSDVTEVVGAPQRGAITLLPYGCTTLRIEPTHSQN